MANESISRRDILRTLAVGALSGSVLRVIPAEAAEYVHQMVRKEKSGTTGGRLHSQIFSGGTVRDVAFSVRCHYSQG